MKTKEQGVQKSNSGKVSKKLFLAWPTKTISTAIAALLIGYATLYATDFMGMNAGVVGVVFMASKIFDGFTDLVAGFLIDKTHTKLGKARPYDLALIGYWLCLVLMFSAPDLSPTGAVIYLFVIYTIANSVFSTLITCNETPYLVNALEDPAQNAGIMGFNGFISVVAGLVGGVMMPMAVASITTKAEWRSLVIKIAIPLLAIGLVRFFVVKEVKDNSQPTAEKVSLKLAAKTLFGNKYILLFAAALLVTNICTSINSGTYFFKYVYGDLSASGLVALSIISAIVAMAVIPSISKKVGLTKVMKICCVLGIVGFMMRLLNLHSLLLLFVSNLLSGLSCMPIYCFAGSFIIDCMDYGEWKTGVRSEAVLSCISGITSKVGTAFGMGLLGILIGLAGYNGELATQSSSANNMIIALYSYIPAALCVLQYIFLCLYNLDKKLPQIREELKAHRAE